MKKTDMNTSKTMEQSKTPEQSKNPEQSKTMEQSKTPEQSKTGQVSDSPMSKTKAPSSQSPMSTKQQSQQSQQETQPEKPKRKRRTKKQIEVDKLILQGVPRLEAEKRIYSQPLSTLPTDGFLGQNDADKALAQQLHNPELWAELLSVLNVALGLWGVKELSEPERKLVAQALVPVLRKYNVSFAYAEELVLAGALISVAAPRVAEAVSKPKLRPTKAVIPAPVAKPEPAAPIPTPFIEETVAARPLSTLPSDR